MFTLHKRLDISAALKAAFNIGIYAKSDMTQVLQKINSSYDIAIVQKITKVMIDLWPHVTQIRLLLHHKYVHDHSVFSIEIESTLTALIPICT